MNENIKEKYNLSKVHEMKLIMEIIAKTIEIKNIFQLLNYQFK